jgi:hypothetical protein
MYPPPGLCLGQDDRAAFEIYIDPAHSLDLAYAQAGDRRQADRENCTGIALETVQRLAQRR